VDREIFSTITGHFNREIQRVKFEKIEFKGKPSRSKAKMTNLFNGNRFLEMAGQAVINQVVDIYTEPTFVKTMTIIAQYLPISLNEIFINTTVTEFFSFFPPFGENVEYKSTLVLKEKSMNSSQDLITLKNDNLYLERVQNENEAMSLNINFYIYFFTSVLSIILIIFILINVLKYQKYRKVAMREIL
jgi:hypothetical protein